MTWISISVFVLLTVGIAAICESHPSAIFTFLVKPRGRSTLADDLAVMSGGMPSGFSKENPMKLRRF